MYVYIKSVCKCTTDENIIFKNRHANKYVFFFLIFQVPIHFCWYTSVWTHTDFSKFQTHACASFIS